MADIFDSAGAPDIFDRVGQDAPPPNAGLAPPAGPGAPEKVPLFDTPSIPSAAILGSARRGGTEQAYTEEPTKSGNPLAQAVIAARGAGRLVTSGAVPPPASRGPAAALPTPEQRRTALGATADVLTGTMGATAPFVAPEAAVARPLTFGGKLLAGYATSKLAGYTAQKLGLSPEAIKFSESLGWFIPASDVVQGAFKPRVVSFDQPGVKGFGVEALPKEAPPVPKVTPDQLEARKSTARYQVDAAIAAERARSHQAIDADDTKSDVDKAAAKRQADEELFAQADEHYRKINAMQVPQQQPTSYRAGVAVAQTPEEYIATAKFGTKRGTIRIPRPFADKGDIFDQAASKDVRASATEQHPDTVATAKDVAEQVGGKAVDPGVKPEESLTRKEQTGRTPEDVTRAQVVTPDEKTKQQATQILAAQPETKSVEPIQAANLPITQVKQESGQPGDANRAREIQVATQAEHDAQAATHPLYAKVQEAKAAGDEKEAEKLQAELDEKHAELIQRGAPTSESIPVASDSSPATKSAPPPSPQSITKGSPVTVDGKPGTLTYLSKQAFEKSRVKLDSGQQVEVPHREVGKRIQAAEPVSDTAPVQGVTSGTPSQPTPKPGAIAWDLDKSLAHYQEGDAAKDPTKIGAPIPANVALAKQQLADGKEVWIHSARSTSPEVVESIKAWTKQHLGRELPVTNLKHPQFAEFYDDRAKPLPSESGTTSTGEPVKTQEKPFKYGSTQANIPHGSDASNAIIQARNRIADDDLAGKGKDVGGEHVTVRYGIQSDDTDGVKKYLAGIQPFEASLGKTSSFPPSDHSDGAAVVIAPIDAPALHKINAELEKHGDFTEPSFKEYKPHATIAYVKPEAVSRYVGMDLTDGKKFTVNEIAITNREGVQEVVSLKGTSDQQRIGAEPNQPAKTESERTDESLREQSTEKIHERQPQEDRSQGSGRVQPGQQGNEVAGAGQRGTEGDARAPQQGEKVKSLQEQIAELKAKIAKVEAQRKPPAAAAPETRPENPEKQDFSLTPPPSDIGVRQYIQTLPKEQQAYAKAFYGALAEKGAYDSDGFEMSGNDLEVYPNEFGLGDEDVEQIDDKLRQLSGGKSNVSKAGTIEPPQRVVRQNSSGINGLISAIYDKLKAGESLGNVTELNRLAEEKLGASRTSGEWTPKDVFDAMEAAVNKYLLGEGARLMKMPADEGLAELRALMSRLTSQGVRTEEQIKNQQFSTPPTESYVAAKVAALKPSDVVLEPSAGNGGLAVWPKAIGAEVHVNEIAPRRQQMLEAAGFDKPSAHDGELINALLDRDIKPTVVLMNPPFSASTTKSFEAKNRNQYGFNHVEQALQRLEPNGRLVAILGGGQANEPEGGASLTSGASGRWFDRMATRYAVRANVRINGKEYAKYGTSFATRIIVFDKVAASSFAEHGDGWRDYVVKGNVDTLEQAYNALKGVEESRPENDSIRPARESLPGRPASQGSVAATPAASSPGVRGVPGRSGEADGEVPAAVPGRGEPVAGAAASRPSSGPEQLPVHPEGGKPEGRDEGAARESAGGSSENGIDQRQVAERGLDLEREAETREREEEDTSAYVTYRPTIKGAKHPGAIVETKSMATVPMPPITYKPNLPESVVGTAPDYKNAKLSAVQLEAVAIAGMQNDIVLPGGFRASALIGDGTGVGKGRESAAILWDNWRKGRRRLVWMTKSKDLINDAVRDLKNLGAHDLANGIKHLGKIQNDAAIDHEGVLFTTYSLFRSKDKKGNTRSGQIDKWLRGADNGNGGYLLMDESHNLKNAVVAKGQQASQVGEAVKKFLEGLPGLRTVSLSATAATDVMNLGYLDRLGLWGPGTPFPGGFQQFAAEISHGGMSAMEMIARELKAQGKYVARTLTFKGVEYSEIPHEITADQARVYDSAVEAWQSVNESIEDTITNTTNGGARQKALAMSQFYSTQQRFFSLLLTSIKIPTAVAEAEKALSQGRSVAITLINTNEAAQNREKARVAAEDTEDDEIPDYDFGAGRMLSDLVREHYPTQQYQDDVDANGKPIKTPVYELDPDGLPTNTPVLNPEAVKARDQLIAKLESELKMPNNPLDELIEQLGGPAKVAELTGRKQRVDPATGKLVNRGGNGVSQDKINVNEMAQFQSGKKRAAILSSAADTGISLHADKDAKNQQPRLCITLQVGWSADKALQMMGRFNRSNQVHPPEYALLKTDAGGENRFISSIARRMQSLEALSKGQTKTNAGTEGMSKVNFETDQGRAAAVSFYNQLLRNQTVPGTEDKAGNSLRGMDVLNSMGVLKAETGGGKTVPPKDRDNVTRLLNRLLALPLNVQRAVYDYYYDIFDAVVKRAEEDGTLDTGVKRIPGDSFSLKGEQSLATDPATGAKTLYYPVDAQVRMKRMSADDLGKMIEKKADLDPKVIRSSKGKLALTVKAKSIIHADGREEEAVYIMHPGDGVPAKVPADNYSSWEPLDAAIQSRLKKAQAEVKRIDDEIERYAGYVKQGEDPDSYEARNVDYYKRYLKEAEEERKPAAAELKIARAEARKTDYHSLAKDEWQKQYEASPSHITTEHHLVGGAVMRFWNPIRESTGHRLDVYSAVDSKTGQRVVGVEIPPSRVQSLLGRITGGKSTVNAEQIVTDVLRNGTQYDLEGGIKVRRGRVAGNNVVQFVSASPDVQRFLKDKGVLYERGIQPIYYLPTGRDAESKANHILENILKQYPAKVEGGQSGGDRESLAAGESGSFTPKAVLNVVNAIDKAYDRGIDAFLQKSHMGRAYPEVERADPQVAADLRELAAAPQYYRAKADNIVKKITAGMTREQEKGFVLLADKASREWLQQNRLGEYQKYITDPRIEKALTDYKPYEEELREKQKALGGPTIDEDYLRRVYAEHVAGVDKTVGKGEQKTVNANRIITPQMANKKGRIASAEYYYHNGLHEFGPSFATRYVATNLKLAEHRAAIHFLSNATKIENKDGLPETIDYNGKTYFRPDVAMLIKHSTADSPEGKEIAESLGLEQLPKPKQVREYSLYDPTPEDKSDYQAKKLAQKLQEAALNASGTKFTPEDMDELLKQAAAISHSNHPLYAGPREIVEAFQSGAKHAIPGWLRDIGDVLNPISGMVRRQVIGLGLGVPHIKNILRRIIQTSPVAHLDPRSYARAAKVLLSKELRERGLKGVDDPAFDALLKHAGISDKGIEAYRDYLDSNTDESAWTRGWAVLKAASADSKAFQKQLLADIKAAHAEGGIKGNVKAAATAVAGAIETPLRPLNFIGHHAIFSKGGIDQRARIWLYDLMKSQTHASDDEIAQAINSQLGRYNKASWTDFQKDVRPFTFFPGWDYSSVEWVLRHPLKTVVPAALLVLLANQALHLLGKNKRKDSTDLSRVHVGKYTVSDNLFRERLASAQAGTALRFAKDKLLHKSNEQALRGALSGVSSDARAFTGMLNPFAAIPLELSFGKELATGKDIVPTGDKHKAGKPEKDWMWYMTHKAFPAYSEIASPQEGQTRGTFALHNLGTSIYKQSRKRR